MSCVISHLTVCITACAPESSTDCEVMKGDDGLLNLYWQRLNYPNTLAVSCRRRPCPNLKFSRLASSLRHCNHGFRVCLLTSTGRPKEREIRTDLGRQTDVFSRFTSAQNTLLSLLWSPNLLFSTTLGRQSYKDLYRDTIQLCNLIPRADNSQSLFHSTFTDFLGGVVFQLGLDDHQYLQFLLSSLCDFQIQF